NQSLANPVLPQLPKRANPAQPRPLNPVPRLQAHPAPRPREAAAIPVPPPPLRLPAKAAKAGRKLSVVRRKVPPFVLSAFPRGVSWHYFTNGHHATTISADATTLWRREADSCASALPNSSRHLHTASGRAWDRSFLARHRLRRYPAHESSPENSRSRHYL